MTTTVETAPARHHGTAARPVGPRLRLGQLLRRPPRGAGGAGRRQRRAPGLLRRGRSTPRRLQEVMAEHFGAGIECFPVFNGTGANVLSLQSLLPRWGAVVCAVDRAHQHGRERRAGAVGGIKLLQVPDPGRQAHAGADRPRGLGLGRRAPRPAAGRVHHPDHRARHLLHARGGPGDRRPRARQGHEAAHGRRAAGQRRRAPGRCRCGPSPATPAWTSSPSAAPRTGCCSARSWWR